MVDYTFDPSEDQDSEMFPCMGNRGSEHFEEDDEDYEKDCIIDPPDAKFWLVPSGTYSGQYSTHLYVSSISNPEHDDIREIRHPDFNDMWANTMENCWEANDPGLSIEKARAWCLSIGMIESKTPLHIVE